MFRKTLAVALLSLFLVGVAPAADLTLEPCINGDVSPRGTAPAISENN
jgi:hypothetical protein